MRAIVAPRRIPPAEQRGQGLGAQQGHVHRHRQQFPPGMSQAQAVLGAEGVEPGNRVGQAAGRIAADHDPVERQGVQLGRQVIE